MTCECGCGVETTGNARFRVGHNNRGRLLPREPLEAKWEANESGCWIWQRGGVDYGKAWSTTRRRWTGAHIVVYEAMVGPVPAGLELDHLCRVHRCVNPTHLEPVTHRVNMQRGEPGRHLRERTHCVHNHEFTEANTYRTPEGYRKCRTCIARRTKAWRDRKAAA